jgi:hypothetical protein
MSQPAASGWLSLERQRVAKMVATGAPFIEVEEVIARVPRGPTQKTELWTLAWSLLGPERQRKHTEWIMEAAYASNPRSSDRSPG